MQVILTTPDEIEIWMTASSEKALKLQRPLADGALRIVARREGRSGRIGDVTVLTLKSRRRSVSSAGILTYRRAGSNLEVPLVHPGGPYWRKKDEGAWSIPKGEMAEGEDAEVAARREFMEETYVASLGSA
jgi:8-oxo-dGTP pyrophosphatase MutT (NUDIX family)